MSESFGIAEDVRSPTQGKAFWAMQFSRWALVPDSMQTATVEQIRKQRVLSPTPPKAEEFYEQA